MVPFGFPGAPDFVRDKETLKPFHTLNWAPTIGYTYLEASSYKAKGFSVRSVWAFPQHESTFSLYGRYLTYDHELKPTTDDAFSYGIRTDLGFSLITGFFSIGKDFGYGEKLKLEEDWLVSFGFSIFGPTTRIPGLSGISRRIYSSFGEKNYNRP